MAESLSLQEKPLSDSPSVEEPNTPTDENSQSCSESTEPAMAVTQAGADLLEILARQVEYYFSTTNLAKDTYVSTLRSLNDGYVPISIISNFGKVQSLVPYDALNAVYQASNEYSNLLEVVFINAETGKRIVPSDTENSSLNMVEAVGPISGEPIPISQISSAFTVTLPTSPTVPSTAVQNTVVLREVPQGIEEAQVRSLFSFETCPAIQSLHRDVANCWFVTLDTSSRDVVVDVMLELRKKKFESGEPVMARLKSGVVVNRDAASYYPGNQVTAGSNPYSTGRKNKKKKSNNKSRSNRNNGIQNKNAQEKKNNGSRQNNGETQKKGNGQEHQQKQESKSNQNRNASSHQSPPRFGEEQFPSLFSDDHLDISENFEVEKVPEHDELGKKNSGTSDSSSTATSSTTSSKSPQPHVVMGGYAAALLKDAAPQVHQEVQNTKQERKKNTDKKLSVAQPKQIAPKEGANHGSAPVEVKVHPPSWGRASFADILRSKEAAMTKAQ